MKLIKPSIISARILTLLDESDEWVIIVSPYMKISKWYKFLNKIHDLKSRRIPTEIYVRDDPDNTTTYSDLDQLALTYKKIPHLHSKLYLNEKYGIVTSMNLLLSSEINSLEIGYITETWEEYKDLLDYFHRYIQMGEPLRYETIANQPVADPKEIQQIIWEEFKRNAMNSWLWQGLSSLHISTGANNYIVSIHDGNLRINAYLRNDFPTEQLASHCTSTIIKKLRNITAMKVERNPISRTSSKFSSKTNANHSLKNNKLQLTANAQNKLESPSISFILKDEAGYIIEAVTKIIEVTDDLVNQHKYNNS